VEQLSELPLAELNDLPAQAAGQVLARCCASSRWIDALVAGRPYESADALAERSDAVVAAMTETDLAAALAAHPRIGDRRAASGGWSRQEQAGVTDSAAAELAAGNAAYEDRFGHIYLVCATGRTGEDLLALLRDRLSHDPAEEWHVVAVELAKINRIRLAKLLGGAP
jgi:2-oxo-4-hydroxy-4-carboxy-5-ureidoimidazoline decarboxylase